MTLRALLTLPALGLLAAPAVAQAVWTIDDAGQTTLHTGPGAGPCSYPLGPLLSFWSYDTSGICATPTLTGAGGEGGLGMDRNDDLLWITDGSTAAAYQNFGTPVITGIDITTLLGATVTGIDWDPGLGGLWVTDGNDVASASLAFTDPCYDAVLGTSFALPTPNKATALTHDPITDSLWVVDDGGFLSQITKAGALGALGSIQVSTTAACGLSTSLTGVAADPAGPAGRIYVTDGVNVAVVDASAGGVQANPTFYSPSSCYIPPSIPLQGMTIGATGNLFGATSGDIFPIIGSTGQSIVPNPSYTINVAGANDTEIALLIASNNHLCPALSILSGIPLHIAPPIVVLGSVTLDVTGFAQFPLPLAPGTPIGETVFFQWGMFNPSTFEVSSTRGLAVTTSLP